MLLVLNLFFYFISFFNLKYLIPKNIVPATITEIINIIPKLPVLGNTLLLAVVGSTFPDVTVLVDEFVFVEGSVFPDVEVPELFVFHFAINFTSPVTGSSKSYCTSFPSFL